MSRDSYGNVVLPRIVSVVGNVMTWSWQCFPLERGIVGQQNIHAIALCD